jgi:hypothetical protein
MLGIPLGIQAWQHAQQLQRSAIESSKRHGFPSSPAIPDGHNDSH